MFLNDRQQHTQQTTLCRHTSNIVRSTGLYRESSYSSSLLGFCLIFFFVSLSPGSCSYHEHELLERGQMGTEIQASEP